MRRMLEVLLLAAASSTTGCVSWYSTSALPLNPSTTLAAHRERTTVAIELKFESLGVAAPFTSLAPAAADIFNRWVANISAWAEDVFDRTDQYEVTENPAAADYRLLLHVRHHGERHPLLLDFLSAITLWIIPSYSTEDFDTEAQLLHRDGTLVGQTTLAHRRTTLTQILLLPAYPFATPRSVDGRMWRHVFGEILTWTDAELAPK